MQKHTDTTGVSAKMKPTTNSDAGEITIKQLRERLGLSAEEFGAKVGLSGNHIARNVYRWERGERTPNGASIILIQNLLKDACKQIENG